MAVTRFDGCQYSSVGFQHGIVDDLLLLGEDAIGREAAGDVARVAVVLSSHVKQAARSRGEGNK